MHDHIKKTVEDLLNMMSESLSLYRSVNTDGLQGTGPNTLNSIIQSKDNSLTALLKEFNKIYPSFKPKSFTITTKSINELYNNMLSLENRTASFVQSDLLPNIPSKNHDGIYTVAANIRSNSESTIVKLNNMLHIRGEASDSYSNILEAVVPLVKSLEIYEKENLKVQAELCNKVIEETQKLFKEKYSKNLIVYTPSYGDSCSRICTKFNIKLLDFLKLNGIKNPYSKLLSKHLIIITD
jgi:hypothetical protein